MEFKQYNIKVTGFKKKITFWKKIVLPYHHHRKDKTEQKHVSTWETFCHHDTTQVSAGPEVHIILHIQEAPLVLSFRNSEQ